MKHFIPLMLALPLALAGGEWETVKNAWSAAESARYEQKGDELHIELVTAGSGTWKKAFPLPAGTGVRITAEASGPRTMNNNVVMTVKFLPRDPEDKTPLPYHYVRCGTRTASGVLPTRSPFPKRRAVWRSAALPSGCPVRQPCSGRSRSPPPPRPNRVRSGSPR